MFGFLKKRTKNHTIGDTLFFGKYPQKSCDDSSPIEWLVLDISEDIALLTSKYAIIPSGYCTADNGLKGLKWVNSLAREVCNNIFYNRAFNNSEKKVIHRRTIKQPSISNLSENIICEDNVFILSEEEVLLYLSDLERRKAIPTEYVMNTINMSKLYSSGGYIPWWLLPQYELGGTVTDLSGNIYSGLIYPKAVNQNGEVNYHSRNVYHNDFAIRPCIQISLAAYKKLVQQNNT